MTYAAPVKAYKYLLKHAVGLDELLALETFSDTDWDLVGDILEGAASFSGDVIAPTNRAGDLNPAQLTEDGVVTSPGFKELYGAFVEGGWQGVAVSGDIGGMGLPQGVSAAVCEMIYASNMAFGLCPMLTSSAIKAISAHASDELKSKYLDKMVSGEWSGAMCLTEPQAGSDLGPVRTKAVSNGDGTYSISGQKIYITWGDHDCADNIIHLVLARLPDAPEGSKGISLFLCPKYLVDEGRKRNDFKAIGLEHKLGIHGSPTCVMEFDGATGWLVGEPNRGLACMFTMMNEARLYVGVQGVAIGERAYQGALAYTQDRVQGRSPGQEPGHAIIGHPDVRRTLLDIKARLMGARAICMATAMASDLAHHHPDPDIQRRAAAREALLTPLAKSYGSDTGVEVSSMALQMHGGMGFVEETGAAQHYRDSRIAPIYEGTNGIQAMDLVGRKVRRDGGDAIRDLLSEMKSVHGSLSGVDIPGGSDLLSKTLGDALKALEEAIGCVLEADDISVLTQATPFQSLVSIALAGTFLIRAAVSGVMSGDENADEMVRLARHYGICELPKTQALLQLVKNAQYIPLEMTADALADL